MNLSISPFNSVFSSHILMFCYSHIYILDEESIKSVTTLECGFTWMDGWMERERKVSKPASERLYKEIH